MKIAIDEIIIATAGALFLFSIQYGANRTTAGFFNGLIAAVLCFIFTILIYRDSRSWFKNKKSKKS